MRATRFGAAALVFAVVAGLAGPTGLVVAGSAQAATSPVKAVATSPSPGDRFATPQTTISFRGITPAGLGSVRVIGSRSGVHRGRLVADPAGATIFRPRIPFVPGERVTVRTGVPIAGAGGDSFSFTVAHVAPNAPEVLPPGSGTGPDATVSTSPEPPSPAGSSRTAATCTPRLPTYHSEPYLLPPGACVNQAAAGTAPGYLFATPAGTGKRGDGAAIFDNRGDLIWYDPVNAPYVHNLEGVTYDSQSMLAFFQGANGSGHGYGEYVLMNRHYQVVSYIRAGNGDQADLHDLTITPQDTALIGCYVPVTMDLTAYGGTANQIVYDYVVQEIDVATGNVLFSWDSLQHVPVTASDYPVPANGAPFDYFHGNSIALTTGGNLLISGRNVSAVYDVNRSTGAITWQLGGTNSSFTLATGQKWFCYQHDVREVAPNTITIFDDGGVGPSTCPNHQSRALTVSINTTSHTATITRDLRHRPPLHAGYLGTNQLLPNGDTFVSWGNLAEITEYNPAEKPIFDMSFSGMTYRTFRVPWTGVPEYPPAVATRKGPGNTVVVYMSWNGDTQVKSWRVLAGSTLSSMRPVGPVKRKASFETKITVNTSARLIEVRARSGSGRTLATSLAVPTNYTPPRSGYYVGTQTGNVYNFDAPFEGSLILRHTKPAATLVGTVTPPTGRGYYLPSAAGNVYNFGARFYGSPAISGTTLSTPVVGMAAYRGTGYYVVTSGGDVYNYGKAPFQGSPQHSGVTATSPISGIAVDPKGGYWLVEQNGGVLNYGAPWYGSARGRSLSGPVVGIAAEPSGDGYLLVTSTGNVYNFGRAAYHGSPADAVVNLSSPVVGIATQRVTGARQQPTGYYVVCANGNVYNFGVFLPGSPNGPLLPSNADGMGTR
jgi:hypothetical protein